MSLYFHGKDEAGNTVPVNGVFYRKILNDFFFSEINDLNLDDVWF